MLSVDESLFCCCFFYIRVECVILLSIMAAMKINDTLSKLYFDVKKPTIFGSLRTLKNKVKHSISTNEIKKWLQNQDVFTLHKNVKYNIKRNHYNISNIGDLYEMDLIDVVKDKKQNDGYSFILTCIDVFSKFAWVRPVKNKTGLEITRAFNDILKNNDRIPIAVQTDRGREFKNHVFRNFLKQKGIKQQFPKILSAQKAAVVERFNRTLKEKMFKYYTLKNTKRFVDIIQPLVASYNNSYHTTIKMKPADVNNNNIIQVYQNTHNKFINEKKQKQKFYVNDYIRIVRKKSRLEHGYTQTYTKEIFQILKVINKAPLPLYLLKDLRGVEVEGKFYADELQKVGKPKKILKTRGLGSTLQYLIEESDGSQRWINVIK